MTAAAHEEESSRPSAAVVERLVAGHREFLSFLEQRLPSRAAAEEVLQAAFVRTLERGGAIRDDESAVAWFYRVLRNALADFYRGQAAQSRALEARVTDATEASEDELLSAVCACMDTLLPTLKPEYAEMIQRVDLREESVDAVAESLSISRNNAAVRLHRARQALKKQLERSCGTCTIHGCLECTCSQGCGGDR